MARNDGAWENAGRPLELPGSGQETLGGESSGNAPGAGPHPARPPVWTSVEENTYVPALWGTRRMPSIALYQGGGVSEDVWPSLTAAVARPGRGTSAVLGVALGPIAAFVRFYREKERSAGIAAFDLSKLGTATGGAVQSLHLGTGAPPWAPPVYDESADGQAFQGIAQFRSSIMGLTDSGDLPDVSWETRGWRVAASGEPDAAARDVAYDLCTMASVGLGLPAGQVQVDVGLDGLAASSYARWCEANGFRVSGIAGAITKREALEQLARSTFASLLYSEGKVKLVPLGAEPLTGNSVTYTPPAPVALDPTDWGDLVIERTPEDQVFNTWIVRFDERVGSGLDYVSRVVRYQDAAHAARYGTRIADEVDAPWLCTRERAYRLAQYLCKASIYQRLRVHFSLSRQYALLEPGDLVSLQDSRVFTTARTFRIRSFDLQGHGRIQVQATEVPTGASVPIGLLPAVSSMADGAVWSAAGAAQESAADAAVAAAAAQAAADAAQASAAGAAALAGSKATVTYAAAPPASPSVGDLWFNTNTSTNCPDLSCKGHAADANGNPVTGAAPHRGLYWAHRWNGSEWLSAETAAQVIASEIAAGSVVASHLAADAIQTSNYLGSGTGDSEYATRGAKMRRNATGAVPALLVDPAGLKIGQTVFDESWLSRQRVRAGVVLVNAGTYSVSIDGATLPSANVVRVSVAGGFGLRIQVPGVSGTQFAMLTPGPYAGSPAVSAGFALVHVQDYVNPTVEYLTIMAKDHAGNNLDPASTVWRCVMVIAEFNSGGGWL